LKSITSPTIARPSAALVVAVASPADPSSSSPHAASSVGSEPAASATPAPPGQKSAAIE